MTAELHFGEKERKKTRLTLPPEQQGYFLLDQVDASLSDRINNTWERRQILDVIEGRESWKQRPKKPALFRDITETGNSEIEIVNPNTWVIGEERFDFNDEKKKYGGLIIISSNLDERNEFVLFDTLDLVRDNLVSKSPVYVVEKRGKIQISELREDILRDAGFVEPRILSRQLKDYILWEARVKKTSGRKAIDIVSEKATPKSRSFSERQLKELIRDYRNSGYEIVDLPESELYQNMKGTKYIALTRSTANMGFGVKMVRRGCGCQVQIDMRGHVCEGPPCGAEHN
ncbi:hypothetical protein A2Z22_03795 [Candidatus Woesebacteria bacterium RBG_16_34_12]|uniref:Uncharacterized protein n=1 Tax=Candidatus Woesebacteria bacterium RBG_16_34_12 TaxID=1802480 RepID=A0A1F7X7S7_9BACT|nr:MAG: hypothetical protein A2Z22_03795 [Candidatus Woesebacteria bacterium RBG_16_34_12]